MRKHQHQTVDRRQDPVPGGSPAHASWQALEAESAARVFAGGTSPGTLFDDGDEEPTESLRTRVTFAGKGTATHEVRDDGAFILAALSREDELGSGDDLMRASRLPSAADRTQLWRVMTPRVVCVRSDLETSALISILIDLDIRAVPVVDAEGRPIGIVSRSDLLRRSHNGNGHPPEQVVDVMMSLAFSLPETASLSRAAAVMAYECIHRIPVVALDGTVVGIISSLDIVGWLARHDGYVVPGGCGGD